MAGTTGAVDTHGYQVYVELISCRSRGATHITSPDINQQPNFRFNFLENDRDVEVFRQAVAKIRQMTGQPALAALTDCEMSPGTDIVEAQALENWIRQCASLSHHLVGSCRMGSEDDPTAVVNQNLQVHGLKNLRIIDASIMPKVPSGNTHATTLTIAEKGSDLILRRTM